MLTRTRSARLLAVTIAVFALLGTPSASAADNPWMERRVLNIAHQGGEIEAPSNTMVAFKTAAQKGADVLELDVHATSDRELVVIHDATVNRTTNGEGRVDSMTLEQIKELDAAYWFVPGCGTCNDSEPAAFTYRGIATGDQKMPKELRKTRRFTADDFKIPTLEEVLQTFPDKLINIEIKATAPDTEPYEEELAALLEEYNRSSDTIVVSFLDHAVERFKAFNADVHTATGTGQTAAFWASSQGELPGAPNPRYQALQVPITFQGVPVMSQDFVDDAHANDLALHVWTINDRETMEELIDLGVDGIMTDRPTLLQTVLEERAVTFD
jgi:glycerophosphoryl diester phosphodiesterase